MRIVQTSNIVNTEGFPLRLERGFTIKRNNVNYQHVLEPVVIPRPKIEDLNALIIVHDKMEVYG
ncbi:MAG: hypothetical protein GX256_02730 [Fretibacterium sp.]|nr:hypothetical protein [Fretibacterium sp.]